MVGVMAKLPARRGSPEVVESTTGYEELLASLKSRIAAAQLNAAKAVNRELVMLYWEIGRDILERQERESWGSSVIDRLGADLRSEFGRSGQGFSRRNLFYMRQLASLWPDRESFVQSPIAQMGWTAQTRLLSAFGNEPEIYAWYAEQAVAGSWSVRHLEAQIDFKLHERQGAALSNFPAALPAAKAGEVQAVTKDPYVIDFLSWTEEDRERHLEEALVRDIQKFLLELGQGFAFYGRQKSLTIGDQEFFLDLIFYHHELRRFVVIDLKIGRFEAEFAGKMNLYLNAVDGQLNHPDDQPAVGIILCTSRDETVAKLALHNITAPIAVSTWTPGEGQQPQLPPAQVTEDVPEDLRAELEGLPEIKNQLQERVARRAPELEQTLDEFIDSDAEEDTLDDE
jgi:predicted nuclease of restriction endonuclease-like (RecB) superfamily